MFADCCRQMTQLFNNNEDKNVWSSAGRFLAPLLIVGAGAHYAGFFSKSEVSDTEITEAQSELDTAEKAYQKARAKYEALTANNPRPTEAAVVLVETDVISEWQQPFTLETEGEAVRYRILTVPTQIGGRIAAKSDACRGGRFVKANTLLFEIDATDYQLDVDRLLAQKRQSEADLKAIDVDEQGTQTLLALAEEDYKLQRKQLERFKTLFSRKATTENELEQVQRQELTARNNRQSLRNQLKVLAQKRVTLAAGCDLVDAQLRRAQADLERTKIVSPVDATVIDDIAEVGNYVKPGDPLVHLSDSSRMEVKLELRASELSWVWLAGRPGLSAAETVEQSAEQTLFEIPRMPCEIEFELQGAKAVWNGVLSRYEGTGIDPNTRTFPCRVLVEKPREVTIRDSGNLPTGVSPPSLLSGMFVTVRIPINSPVPILSVPATAVRPGGQLWLNREGKLKIVNVNVARTENSTALILKAGTDLQPGERVVVSPMSAVREGMLLKDQTPNSSAAESVQ